MANERSAVLFEKQYELGSRVLKWVYFGFFWFFFFSFFKINLNSTLNGFQEMLL